MNVFAFKPRIEIHFPYSMKLRRKKRLDRRVADEVRPFINIKWEAFFDGIKSHFNATDNASLTVEGEALPESNFSSHEQGKESLWRLRQILVFNELSTELS